MNAIGVCTVCKREVEKREDTSRFRLKPSIQRLDSVLYNVPFYCPVCGSIRSPLTALHDFVFVYPLRKQSVLGSGILVRPKTYVPELSDYGIILSFGPGYYKKGKFIPIKDLQVGMRVVYDKTVPWEEEWPATNHELHLIKYMTFLDIKLVPEE